MFHIPLHLFHSLAVTSYNIPDMFDLIEIIFQLIDLPQDIMKSSNLGICNRNRGIIKFFREID